MGQIVSLIYPGVSGPGPAVTYYRDHGKVTGIDSPSQVLLDSASWSPAGLPLQLDPGRLDVLQDFLYEFDGQKSFVSRRRVHLDRMSPAPRVRRIRTPDGSPLPRSRR